MFNLNVLKSLTLFSIIVFNVHSSFDIENRLLKFSVIIIDMLMEGTVSQIFYLGLSSSVHVFLYGFKNYDIMLNA